MSCYDLSMNDEYHKKEGILLKLHPYRDQMDIATIFFPDQGLAEGILHRNRFHAIGLDPPLQGEWIYKHSRGQLLFIQQVSPTNQFLQIRKSYDHLAAAGTILHATLNTQGVGRPAPQLYRLCEEYLQDLDQANPLAIAASYQLKTLRHEGWLDLLMPCLQCGQTPRSINLMLEGIFCSHHSPNDEFTFNEEETQKLQLLAYAKRKEWIYSLEIDPSLTKRIHRFFLLAQESIS